MSVINGTVGNDTLTGTIGDDTVDGMAGTDTLSYANATDGVSVDLSISGPQNTFGAGTDTLTSIENLIGSAFIDRLRGDAGANALQGGDGNDNLVGGPGNDTLDGSNGIDEANYADAPSAVTVNLSIIGPQDTLGAGIDQLISIEGIRGSAFDDILTGDNGSNVLIGLAGNDTMRGGAGNDSYFLDSASDVVIENAGEGVDTVFTGISYTLPANVENLEVGGLAFGTVTLTGNELDNRILGGAFNNDVIDGGLGADTMIGRIGDDTYYVDNVGDIVIEAPGEGTDSVFASVNYTLGNDVENLTLTGTNAINGTGNGLSNVITGNNGANTLSGGDGDDTLSGGGGDDTLEGSLGNDSYNGGSGFDTVTFANATGPVTLDMFQQIRGPARSETLGISIERIVGSAFDDNLRASSVTTTVEGGAGNDVLTGDSGDDTLRGGAGDDTMYEGYTGPGRTSESDDIFDGGAGNDTVALLYSSSALTIDLRISGAQNTGGAGHDTFVNVENFMGSLYNDTITGDAGANILKGYAGNDTLNGVGGNDTLYGEDGDDQLAGGAGIDTLVGGLGADTFLDTVAGLNGDHIADMGAGDRIALADASIANFTYSLTGNTLTFSGGSLILDVVPTGHLRAQGLAIGGVELSFTTGPLHPAANDFNGDGHSDILWRNDNGQLQDWLSSPNGTMSYNAAGGTTAVPTEWTVAATGDFNGDGRADILWRNTTGTVGDWLGQANGGFTITSLLIGVPTSWKVAGTGDFNGDGYSDILWRNDNGVFGDWYGQANGGFTINSGLQSPVPTDWKIAAVGDFNGDGRDDILWRNNNGAIGSWSANTSGGFAHNPAGGVIAVPNSWHIEGVGDFNGDGRDDILWRNDNGAIADWLSAADGSYAHNAAFGINPVPNDWHIAAIGDYNGDGRDDIMCATTMAPPAAGSASRMGRFRSIPGRA